MVDHLVKPPFAEEEISAWRERKGEREGKKSFLEYPHAREPLRAFDITFSPEPQGIRFHCPADLSGRENARLCELQG